MIQLIDTGSLFARRAHRLNALAFARSLNRLATGDRIHRAAEDPAGLIASESLRATLATLDAETSANERALNQSHTADAAMAEASGLLTEAKRLVLANANDSGLSADEKAANQVEIDSILSTVDRLGATTRHGGARLLDGSATISASGASHSIDAVSTSSLGETEIEGQSRSLRDLKSGGALDSTGAGSGSADALTVVDRAIFDITNARGRLGAFAGNTLERRLSSVQKSREQITSAVSMLRDVDYASEVSRNVGLRLVQQASVRMLGIGTARRRGGVLSVFA